MIRRAHGVSSAVAGRQTKMASAARRVADAGRVERSGDREGVHVRIAGEIHRVGGAALPGLQPPPALDGRLREKRHADLVRTGGQRQTHAQALVHRIARRRRVVARGGDFFVAAEAREVHPLAVDRNFQLLGYSRPRIVPRFVRNSLTRSSYSPSRGSVGSTAVPPTVPSGSPSMCLSCDASCRTRYIEAAGDVPIADREVADPSGGLQIPLEQHRRDAQEIGVVVEAVPRIVGREQRGDVDFQRQQIAHRVPVLGAVQPVQHRPAGIRLRRGGAVELRLEPAAQRAAAAASGRGAPCGGIMPPRSLRTAFSQTSAWSPTCARLIFSNETPARLEPIVVARDAVLGDLGLMPGRGRWPRERLPLVASAPPVARRRAARASTPAGTRSTAAALPLARCALRPCAWHPGLCRRRMCCLLLSVRSSFFVSAFTGWLV